MNYDVIIVGAGPVGLLLANLLGANNIKTLVLEKNYKMNPGSRAIGISPPSLGILSTLNLDKRFIQNGIKGKIALFNSTSFFLGALKIKSFPSNYPFILSLPQSLTEFLLNDNLKNYKSITLYRGYTVVGVKSQQNEIIISCKINGTEKECIFHSKIVCACDGEKSIVRDSINIPFIGNFYKPTFIMGDYINHSRYQQEAVLWFTKNGTVESFPLSKEKRRWIIQTSKFIKFPKKGYLEKIILQRSGIHLKLEDKLSENSFSVNHFLADTFFKDGVFLCGDSAHTMSPIGGQGMNTGFADAEFLAYIVCACIKNQNLNLKKPAKYYEYYRKIAVKSATKLADLGMKIGTARCIILSIIRSIILAFVLHTPLTKLLAPYFAMLKIPYNRLEKVLVEKDIIKNGL